jgi:pantetheine-phosphate adenylyltransferase
MAIALYPGTFDPVTYGHLDVLTRASRLFDRVIIAVASGNSAKSTLFTPEERLQMVLENLEAFDNVTVELFDGLLVEHAREKGATVLVRGLRVVSDFEYEFQMAQMNRHLDASLETIFLMPSQKYFFTSSQLIKQVHRYGGQETGLVPENVRLALKERSGNTGE